MLHLNGILFASDNEDYQKLHVSIIEYLKFLKDKSLSGTLIKGHLESWYMFPEVKQLWLGFRIRQRRVYGGTFGTIYYWSFLFWRIHRRSTHPRPHHRKTRLCWRIPARGVNKKQRRGGWLTGCPPLQCSFYVEFFTVLMLFPSVYKCHHNQQTQAYQQPVADIALEDIFYIITMSATTLAFLFTYLTFFSFTFI